MYGISGKTIFMFYSSTLRLPKIVTSGSHVYKGNIEERIRVCYHEIKQFKKKKDVFNRIGIKYKYYKLILAYRSFRIEPAYVFPK